MRKQLKGGFFINSKRKLILACMLLVLVLGVGASFAADSNQTGLQASDDTDTVVSIGETDTVSSNDDEVYSAGNDSSVLSATAGSFTELSTLINSSTTGSITLNKDYTYNSATDNAFVEGILIDKTISIDGAGFTINGNGEARMFKVTGKNVLIRDVTFLNGYTASNAGAIDWSGANGYLVGSTFKNNTAAVMMGAIQWTGVEGTISKCSFLENHAQYRAAIYASGTKLKITDSVFDSNYATGTAIGAIRIASTYATIENCVFKNNWATTDAGAILWEGTQGLLTNCTFYNNHANNYGALQWTSTYGTVENCLFENNYATTNGGAAYFKSTGHMVYNSIFNNNSAGNNAGGLFFEADTGIVQNCSFNSNRATTTGGGFYSSNNNIMRYCSFFNNTAKTGGGLFENHANFKLENSNFTNNSATNGGGAYVKGGLSYCLFEYNNATNGGGIHISGAGYKIDTITFYKNEAENGGAIYTSTYGYGAIVNSKFEENTANNNGGAINCMAEYVSIDNCEFTKNTAGNIGGGVYANKNYFSVIASTFNGNKAENENSGAIYITSGVSASAERNTYKTSTDTVNIEGINSMPSALYVSPNGGGDGSSINSPMTLTAAISAIANGGTIYVTPGEYTGLDTITLAKTTKFVGLDGAIFNLQNLAKNFININNFNCYFENLIFINGNTKYTVIVGSNGRQFAYIYNCTFKNNGRAISAGGRYWIIDKCIFSNNAINDVGGAFYSSFTGSTVLNSIFIGNNGTQGGALYLNGQDHIVRNCTFINNHASTNGGAISFTGYNFNEVSGCTFINNSASNSGGAIYCPSQQSFVDNCTFTNNSAKIGGAYYTTGIKNEISGSEFSENSASAGGAIYSTGNELSVSQSNFTSNNASESGGAIYSIGSGTSVTGSAFEENSATNGSAIMVGENTDIIIEGSDFNSNSGNGSVYVPEGSNFVIDSETTFENNDGGDLVTPGVVSALVLYVNITATGDGLLVTGPTNWEQGFENVLDGGTLYILPGTYDFSQLSPIKVEKSLSIIGLGDVVFTNYARGQLFDIKSNNVKLSNIKFTSITGNYIAWDGTNGEIESCDFDGSSTNSNSKLISTSVGSTNFKVTDSNFTGFKYTNLINTANYLTTVDNCIFKSNTPYNTNSYLIDATGSDFSIVNSEFTSNTAKLVNFETSATRSAITGTTFTSNTVGSGNSMIYINSKSSSISDSTFKSSNTGGTYKNVYGTEDFTLSGNTFEGVGIGLNSVSTVIYPNNPTISGTFNYGVNKAYNIPVTANNELLPNVARSNDATTFTYSWDTPLPDTYTLKFANTDANGNKYTYTSTTPSVTATVNRLSTVYISPDGTGTGASASDSTNWDNVANVLTESGSVVFTAGTYKLSGKTISKSWKLSNSGNVIIDAENKGRIFTINANNVEITGITFKNGKVSGNQGSAISWTGTGGKITNSIFNENTGVPISSANDLTITNTQMKNQISLTKSNINWGTTETVKGTFSHSAPSTVTVLFNGASQGSYAVSSKVATAAVAFTDPSTQAVGSYVVTDQKNIPKEVF